MPESEAIGSQTDGLYLRLDFKPKLTIVVDQPIDHFYGLLFTSQ